VQVPDEAEEATDPPQVGDLPEEEQRLSRVVERERGLVTPLMDYSKVLIGARDPELVALLLECLDRLLCL
jgi:hypothetical protein